MTKPRLKTKDVDTTTPSKLSLISCFKLVFETCGELTFVSLGSLCFKHFQAHFTLNPKGYKSILNFFVRVGVLSVSIVAMQVSPVLCVYIPVPYLSVYNTVVISNYSPGVEQ